MSRGAGTPPPLIRGYRYLRDLGVGGFSTVYLYRQESTDRDVAVKVLRLEGSVAADEAIAEAKVMARFERQPNIVQIYDANRTEDGQPYIIMSYCAGSDLWSLVKTGPFAVARVVRIGVLIAAAVHTAHSFDVVHRDIKPANILTDEQDIPWLTDFGIAGRLTAIDDTDFGYSLPWTPPEILDGRPATRASDVYSLGATLWNLIAGKSPFEVAEDNSTEAMTRRIRSGKMTPLRSRRDDVPSELDALLRRMLATQPSGRPESAGRVAQDLEKIEALLPKLPAAPVRPSPPPAPVAPEVDPDTRDRPRFQPAASGVPEFGTTIYKGPAVAHPTRQRVPEAPPPVPVTRRPRSRTWLAVAAAVVLLAGGGYWGLHAAGITEKPVFVPGAPTDQDAGSLGDELPPGTPTVTAVRVDATTLRFSWMYSAALSSDTFRWRTVDGSRSDTTPANAIELPVKAGVKVCVQVKVVRSSGKFATTDWSPAGCGS